MIFPYKKSGGLLLVLFLLIIFVSSEALAEARFTSGFRGIDWNTHKDQLPDLGLSKKALKNIYKSGPASVLFMEGKGNLDLMIDDVPLLSIFMHFYDQQFVGVDMLFRPEDRKKVVSIIANDYGDMISKTDIETCWQSDNVKIIITDRELMVSLVTL
jgi:hypothetical protein